MKFTKIKSAFSAVAAFSLLGVVSLAPLAQVANAEVTAPVGYVKLTFNGTADTPFSLPMDRPKAYAGQVASISGNEITVANNDFTANEFVYVDGTQQEKYYLLFTTGTLEGKRFDVTVNSANSITVNPDHNEPNTALHTDIETQINDASATDNFTIRPHWTLNTVFPNGDNFATSSNPFNADGLILTRTISSNGINISPTKSYMYFDSSTDSQDGWYDSNDLISGTKNDLVLRAETFFVFSNKSTSAEVLNLVGDVPLTDSVTLAKENVIKQDSFISMHFPTNVSLADSGLLSSSSFQVSTDPFSIDGDLLLVYGDNITIYNPSPIKAYFYFDSSVNSQDGWYDSNDLPGGKQDSVEIFKPGKGYIIRKGSAVSEQILDLQSALPYDPFAP